MVAYPKQGQKAKKTLLLVVPELPFPPTKNGLTLRYYPMIRELSKYMTIDLVCFSEKSKSLDLGDLSRYSNSITVLNRDRSASTIIKKLQSLLCKISPWGIPYEFYHHDSITLAHQIIISARGKYDAVLWAGSYLGYLSNTLRVCKLKIRANRWILDLIDSPSLHWRRSLGDKTILNKIKLKKVRQWEASMIRECDLALYISIRDKNEIISLVGQGTEIQVLPNGIFLDSYSKDTISLRSPSIGFLGNMSYGPNVEAVHDLIRIHKQARKRILGLHLYVIGRDPLPEIQVYNKLDHVTVTGTLDNIWPHVNSVDLFVLPMRTGAGQQNKMLEIMFAGRPVISSSIANGGVGAMDGDSVVIANDERSCIDAIVKMFNEQDHMNRIALRGEEFVKCRFNWVAIGRDAYNLLIG